ncbi:unnamed protein product [Miscanthus lutarioriparius]|uniref:Uncharacterized protein n=1 Tax=Miscanthus lutarioriparius TaxID=422564 RepID=A0A811PJ94_9POAL|nr:unnamed protein product [Miscanthus lutarioriparius]
MRGAGKGAGPFLSCPLFFLLSKKNKNERGKQGPWRRRQHPIEVQPQIQTEKKKGTRTSTASMYSKTTARWTYAATRLGQRRRRRVRGDTRRAGVVPSRPRDSRQAGAAACHSSSVAAASGATSGVTPSPAAAAS